MKLNLSKLLQLIPEGILFYFILVPIFSMSRMQYPFWSYLVIVMITLFLFDAGIKLTKSYLVYLPILLLSLDRKSTRLNSSHVAISYAVFCLKKKRMSN